MKKNIALVLSGGGARGMSHIGVIEELEQQGYKITSIAGTSMGSVVGAVYALDKMEEFKTWVNTMYKKDVFKLIDFTLSKQGLVKGDRIFNKMREFIPDKNIEDLKIDFTCIATDIKNKKEIVYSKGDIFEAIRASVSIPMVFTPVSKGTSLIVDGGVMNNIPINYVKRNKNDILIAVNVNAEISVLKKPKEKTKKNHQEYLKKIHEIEAKLTQVLHRDSKNKMGYFDLINRTVELLTHQVSKLIIEKYPPDILINISRESCGLFEFYKAEELIKIGQYAAKQALKKYNE
jgi:NTE family protein